MRFLFLDNTKAHLYVKIYRTKTTSLEQKITIDICSTSFAKKIKNFFHASFLIRKRTKADKIALSSTHHKMGRIYEFLGDKVNARKHYKKSIKWKKRKH